MLKLGDELEAKSKNQGDVDYDNHSPFAEGNEELACEGSKEGPNIACRSDVRQIVLILSLSPS